MGLLNPGKNDLTHVSSVKKLNYSSLPLANPYQLSGDKIHCFTRYTDADQYHFTGTIITLKIMRAAQRIMVNMAAVMRCAHMQGFDHFICDA